MKKMKVIAPSYICLAILTYPHPGPQPRGRSGGAAAAAVAAAATGTRQSHRAGWLEQKSDVFTVSGVFGRFRAILTFERFRAISGNFDFLMQF